MSVADAVTTLADLMLRPDPSRTVVRPFDLEYPQAFATGRSRPQVIAARVLGMDEAQVTAELKLVTRSLDERHRDVDALLVRRFDEMKPRFADDQQSPRDDQQRLIGAYFSEEYAFEAAALFNPSMILHPDQSGLANGAIRFVMSLRGIGEGHVSSVTFRTGTWGADDAVVIDRPSGSAVPPQIDTQADDGSATLHCGGASDVSETVLFPILPSQRQGIEDMRLVRFAEDDGSRTTYGTYTAFSGAAARPEMVKIGDRFERFEMRPLTGNAGGAKGMALFPEKIDGRYAMLGRQDSENVWLLTSDDLYHWEGGAKLIEPRYPWEYVQMGNCGSPIAITEGWLILTHGVGTVRNYCMGATLVDRNDPSKLLARTPEPLLEPNEDDRDGYVPNVVYSCGAVAHGRTLLLPYGVADNFTMFASVSLDKLIAAME